MQKAAVRWEFAQGMLAHEGHISRTLLALMESDGVVEQDEDSKRRRLK